MTIDVCALEAHSWPTSYSLSRDPTLFQHFTLLLLTLCAPSSVPDTCSSLMQVFKTKTSFHINKVRRFTSITYTRFASDTPEKFL